MKSKCYIHGETCPGPAGAGAFSSSAGSQVCSGRGRAWTGQNPAMCLLCPHAGTKLSLGALLIAGGQRAWIKPPAFVLAPPSLGHTSDPSASMLLGAVQLEVTDLGLGAVSGMRAGSCGASSLPEDILAGFLAGPCCPSVSTLFLEEQEHLQGLCTESCQVTALLPVPQETVLAISQALSLDTRSAQFTSDTM